MLWLRKFKASSVYCSFNGKLVLALTSFKITFNGKHMLATNTFKFFKIALNDKLVLANKHHQLEQVFK